jgi:hypothetical protein
MRFYAASCEATLTITMTSGRTGHWTKMHQSLVKFSESEASNHTPCLADLTTTTPELKFSVHTGGCYRGVAGYDCGRSGGRVSIGAVSTAKYFVPFAIAAFSKLHPRIDISLSIGTSGYCPVNCFPMSP